MHSHSQPQIAWPQASSSAFDQFFDFDGHGDHPEGLAFSDNTAIHASELSSPYSFLKPQPSSSNVSSAPFANSSTRPPMEWSYPGKQPFASKYSPFFNPATLEQQQQQSSPPELETATTPSDSLSPPLAFPQQGFPPALLLPNKAESERDYNKGPGASIRGGKSHVSKTRKPRKAKKADLESTQAVAKRSKFLERNRVAASKCRQKKKEWATGLDSKARELHLCRESLGSLVDSLKAELLYLKGEMLKHSSCNYPPIKTYIHNQIGDISKKYSNCSSCSLTNGEDMIKAPQQLSPGPHFSTDDKSGLLDATPMTPSSVTSVASEDSLSNNMLEALLLRDMTQDTSPGGIATRLQQHAQTATGR